MINKVIPKLLNIDSGPFSNNIKTLVTLFALILFKRLRESVRINAFLGLREAILKKIPEFYEFFSQKGGGQSDFISLIQK